METQKHRSFDLPRRPTLADDLERTPNPAWCFFPPPPVRLSCRPTRSLLLSSFSQHSPIPADAEPPPASSPHPRLPLRHKPASASCPTRRPCLIQPAPAPAQLRRAPQLWPPATVMARTSRQPVDSKPSPLLHHHTPPSERTRRMGPSLHLQTAMHDRPARLTPSTPTSFLAPPPPSPATATATAIWTTIEPPTGSTRRDPRAVAPRAARDSAKSADCS